MFKKCLGLLAVLSMIAGTFAVPVSAEETTETVSYGLTHSVELNSVKDDNPLCHDNRTNLGIRIDDSIANTASEYVALVFDTVAHPEAVTNVKLTFKPATPQKDATYSRTIKLAKYNFGKTPSVPAYYCNTNNKAATHYCNRDINSDDFKSWYEFCKSSGEAMSININPLSADNEVVTENDGEVNGIRTVNKKVNASGLIEINISDIFKNYTSEAPFTIIIEEGPNSNISDVMNSTSVAVTYDTSKYKYQTDYLLEKVMQNKTSQELTEYFETVKASSDFSDYNVAVYDGISNKNMVWSMVLEANTDTVEALMNAFNNAVSSLTVSFELYADEDAFINGAAYQYANDTPTMGNSKFIVSQFDLSEISNAGIISAGYSVQYSLCKKLNASSNNSEGICEIGEINTLKRFDESGTYSDYFAENPTFNTLGSMELKFTNSDVTTNDPPSLKNITAVSCDITASVKAAKLNGEALLSIYAKPNNYSKLYNMESYLKGYIGANGTAARPAMITVVYDRTNRLDAAVSAINNASDTAEMLSALYEYSVELGIDQTKLDVLSDSALEEIAAELIGKSFGDSDSIKAAYDSAVIGKEEAPSYFEYMNCVIEEAASSKLVKTVSFKKIKSYGNDMKIAAAAYKDGRFCGLAEIDEQYQINKMKNADVGDNVTVKFGGSSSGSILTKQADTIKIFVLRDYSSLRPVSNPGVISYTE